MVAVSNLPYFCGWCQDFSGNILSTTSYSPRVGSFFPNNTL
jgi:hypothetical protein